MTIKSDNKIVRRIVVVGGGTAGWIAAARVAAAHKGSGDDAIEVCLVESPNTPIIGVGEGTWPTLRNTLAKIGLSETEFLRATDAAFKQGAQFVGWTDGGPHDAYYHPLNPPAGAGELDLSSHWRVGVGDTPSFAHAVDFQAALCDAGLAPKLITNPEFGGLANYAYHLDAAKFAKLMCDHAVQRLGVRHVVDDVVAVRQTEDGDIASLRLASGDELEGDLFIDCSGFRGLLIGGTYGVPLRGCRDVLFANRALALQVPYATPEDQIVTHTVATAQGAGWVWDIGLWSRRGVGYVYSSDHTSDDEAETVLRRYIGAAADGLSPRRLDINSGYRQIFWTHNCVAVGLSGGFIEPLEASSLMLIEIAMDSIADRLPRTRSAMRVLAKQFNTDFEHHWRRIIEFLKLHYVLTQRTDTPFWRDNVAPSSIPDALKERLQLWRDHPPSAADFPHAREVFSWPSYQYILQGMRYPTCYDRLPNRSTERAAALRLLERAASVRTDAVQRLRPHRQLLASIREYGLQVV